MRHTDTRQIVDAIPRRILPVCYPVSDVRRRNRLPLPLGGSDARFRASGLGGHFFLFRYSGSGPRLCLEERSAGMEVDRKSTRLNSSHANTSYAVFCLKKKTHSP